MALLTRPERLALLINLLGEDAEDVARNGLTSESRAEFDDALADFRDFPPSQEEVATVLEDFEAYFQMALDASEKQSDTPSDPNDPQLSVLQVPEEQFDVEIEPTKKFTPPTLSGNVVVDLNKLHPYQVAQALRNEQPDLITLVIRKLADEHAAKTLEFMPSALRSKIFLQLATPARTKPMIEDIVLEKTLQIAVTIEQREEQTESAERMSKLMRSLPRSLRGPMLEELEKSDPDLAEDVKSKLYLFEDLNALEPRDLQKLLAQCQTDVLVVALQNVDEELLNHVLNNMSKRAKQSLQEEMEFKQNAKQEEIDDGRQEVVKVLAELVESGSVTLE